MLAKAVALIGVISSSLVIAVSTSFRHQRPPALVLPVQCPAESPRPCRKYAPRSQGTACSEVPQSFVTVLCVAWTWHPGRVKVLMVDTFPEGEVRISDIDAVVVVQRTGTDVLIGHALQDIDQLIVTDSILSHSLPRYARTHHHTTASPVTSGYWQA